MKPTTEKCVRVSPLILTFTIECDDLPRGSSSLRPLDSERAVTVQYGKVPVVARFCVQVKSRLLHCTQRKIKRSKICSSRLTSPHAHSGPGGVAAGPNCAGRRVLVFHENIGVVRRVCVQLALPRVTRTCLFGEHASG